ncbi:MAG: 3-hydroxyacyl-CoA dehydrogenase family protein [Hyphomicrobiales bacterium]
MPNTSPTRRTLVTGESSASLSHAALLAHYGFETILLEEDESGVLRSTDFLKRLYDGQPVWAADENKPTALPLKSLSGRFDVLIDAGDTNLKGRFQTLNQLSNHLNPHAFVAFQTSMPDPQIAEHQTADFPHVHQFHISGPPHLAKLVECAAFENTDNDVFSAFWHSLGKKVVSTRVEGHFVSSRLSTKLYETLDVLLLEGALPYEIDEALAAFGFKIGPFEAQDLSGLDGPYYERKQLRGQTLHPYQSCIISDRMVQEGRLGKKVGVGWYRYPGGGGAVIDPLLEDLIVEEARFAKIERRQITDQEIVSRVVAALIDEATPLLEKGIVATASQLDYLSIQALHFPHGGIYAYARQHSL